MDRLPDPVPFWKDHVVPLVKDMGNRAYFAADALPFPAILLLLALCVLYLRHLTDTRPSTLPSHLADLKSPSRSPFSFSLFPRSSPPTSFPRRSSSLPGAMADAYALPGMPIFFDWSSGPSDPDLTPSGCGECAECNCTADGSVSPRSMPRCAGLGLGCIGPAVGSGRLERGHRPAQTQTRRGSGRKGSAAWRCGLRSVPERDEEEEV